MMRRIKNQKGVTLVELILVIAMIGVVMAAALSFFLFGTKTFTLGSNQAKVQQEARLATSIVSQDLRTAINVSAFKDPSLVTYTSNQYVVIRIGDDPGPYSLRYIRPSGTLDTDDVFTSLTFSIQVNATTGKKFVLFEATGEENGRDSSINSTMLLENDQLSTLVVDTGYIALVFDR